MTKPFRGKVWIVPTWNGAGLALLLFGTWYSAASQGNGAAYLFLFVLTGVALVSIIHTWMNLRDWDLRLEQPEPAFAGQEVACPIEAINRSRTPCYALKVMFSRESSALFHELGPGKASRTEFRFIAPRRGAHRISKLKVITAYPLGFFKGSRWVGVDQRYLVYPNPGGNESLPASPGSRAVSREGVKREGDDFAGMRGYREGESQRHIDWKAVARGQPLLVKQFAGEQDEKIHLDWETLSPLGREERLSQLALWVIKAERSQCLYGLRLPGVTIAPARGEAQYHRCLGALAIYPEDLS